MMKKASIFFLLFNLLSRLSLAALLPVTPEELVQGADLICIAEVKRDGIQSHWATRKSGDRWIESRVTLRVLQFLKGEGPEEIAIETIGGIIGDFEARDSVSAWFKSGETVVVFLKKKADNLYSVYKLRLGKYTVTPDRSILETEDTFDQFLEKINVLLFERSAGSLTK